MVNVEERTSKYNRGICPDCNLKLEKTELGKDKPFLYCKKCNNSFEICGGQVMSQGDAIKRSNDKWREYRESCGDNGYGVGLMGRKFVLKGTTTGRYSSGKEQSKMAEKSSSVIGKWYKRIKSNWDNFKEGEIYKLVKIGKYDSLSGIFEDINGNIVNVKAETPDGYVCADLQMFDPIEFPSKYKDSISSKIAEKTEFVVGNWYKRVYVNWCNFKRGEIYKLIEIDPCDPAYGIFADVNNHIVNLKSQEGNYGYVLLKRFVPVDSPFKTKDVCETESDMERLRREVIPYDCYGREAHLASLQKMEQ